MQYLNISHKKNYKGAILESSGESDKAHSIEAILKDDGYWCTPKRTTIQPDFFIIDYGKEITINHIEISASQNGKKSFPDEFQLEISSDGKYWNIIHSEKAFDLGDSALYAVNIPLTELRYIKFLITVHKKSEAGYYSEISRFTAGIAGVKSIKAGSSSQNHGCEKLFDNKNDTYWESSAQSKPEDESIEIDLGNVYHINKIVLSSANLAPHCFPVNLSIETSTDSRTWTHLFDERNFIAGLSKKYFWNINTIPAQFMQITMKGVSIDQKSFGVRLAELEIYAAPYNSDHIHNIGEITPHASIFQAGIVRLAKDSETSAGTAVQADDSRLRDASTIFKGIVQLSEDGDSRKGFAVQASDTRLKYTTELSAGIVKLAKDREYTPGLAVQSDDTRLREATEQNHGIVKLCPDGVYSELGVIRGNDSRLGKATESSCGIVRLAEDCENNTECAVQGNDSRLRDATITYRGIVELAEDGETKDGVVVQGNDKRLKDATTSAKGIVELAENGEDKAGVVVQGNDKRLKDATTLAKGIVELAEDGEDRAGVVVQGNDKRLKNATTSIKGISRFANDGEASAMSAVQGNDRRLKDATTATKGIVELAENGEDSEDVVVQGNDRRLKDATTISKGIVELAEDGEDSEGVAVQGSDMRLKDATITAKGIVRLADDGEARQGSVVQGNDRRLKDATTSIKGIMRFAGNGEDSALSAVQGNDKRLREATTAYPGIVELAEDGEAKEGVAVQGSDKRLKNATTTAKGIVELAEDGEDRAGIAVQGNDRRLKEATEKTPGITRLAKSGETRSGSVVQADDMRLSDARTSLPHTHEYAPTTHEYNSHTGTIKITGSKAEKFQSLVPPGDESAVIYAKNDSASQGAIGIAGITNPLNEKAKYSYGVVGHSRFVGVRGQSTGSNEDDAKGCGVMGVSRFGAGGIFASEHSYSLIADGHGNINNYDNSLNFKGKGDALYVNGKSVFNGRIMISNSPSERDFPVNFAEMFEVDEAEFIISGDILIASEKGNSILKRSSQKYSRAVIGIVSGNPTIIINNSGKDKKIYPVALGGKTFCRVDSRERPVKPGDLIVTSDTPGCGMAGDINSFDRIGTVIGKALESINDAIGVIPVFIARF